jgi:hypothetical protein
MSNNEVLAQDVDPVVVRGEKVAGPPALADNGVLHWGDKVQ